MSGSVSSEGVRTLKIVGGNRSKGWGEKHRNLKK